MILIIHQWGADYLVYDEPVAPEPKIINSPQGITLAPGRTIKQIGKKRRSCFSLIEPYTMTYEGLLHLNNLCYAVFHCSAHDEPQLDLFGTNRQYRYAFACVFVKEKFQCFLVGPGGSRGLSDIQLDFLA
ncbi:hypothetical protein BH10BAC3_BH10BAC3_12130 [soil metagenome]